MADGGQRLTDTDLQVEMIARCAVEDAQDGETAIPARKLFEIIRALPDGSRIAGSALVPQRAPHRQLPLQLLEKA